MPTFDHLYRCEESVGGCEVITAPGSPASSYAPTLACWSIQTDYNSDCTRRLSQESPTRAVSTSSTLSSPVSDTNTQSSDRTLTQSLPESSILLPDLPSDEWKPVSWPTYVNPLGSHDNPRDYKFSVVPEVGRCGCSVRCSAPTCNNALNNRCCFEGNCSFSGECSNSLQLNPNLVLCARGSSGYLGMTAVEMIPKGEVIGEYCGYLTEFGDLKTRAAVDNGCHMLLDTPTVDGKSIGIDALWCGTMMRFVNHHCDPNCRFLEVRAGQYLTVAAVTLRDVLPEEEITVSYGDQLWFICRCGWWGCQHRHLQHL
ncbi:unnamed protein product [Phytophthora fragariaefolia]|uniref:Unnamed protein product n=1 Tax=Phytophthora fragariaefolia TaxID=1490495 RepID=A0A9W6WPQ4_9STRA|nr:unnamed protein product [Phytophthora fragariaefolia]